MCGQFCENGLVFRRVKKRFFYLRQGRDVFIDVYVCLERVQRVFEMQNVQIYRVSFFVFVQGYFILSLEYIGGKESFGILRVFVGWSRVSQSRELVGMVLGNWGIRLQIYSYIAFLCFFFCLFIIQIQVFIIIQLLCGYGFD